ncbi:UDP-glucuronate 4-epimerase 2 [Platanthera guangdongensis]|uniref:UDP-glucuronate 4-epimerase 2 n=1 Tax=Platanthera guangdongensis TaxID=2320717 RepID=A0ABR2LQK5_9ASPA
MLHVAAIIFLWALFPITLTHPTASFNPSYHLLMFPLLCVGSPNLGICRPCPQSRPLCPHYHYCQLCELPLFPLPLQVRGRRGRPLQFQLLRSFLKMRVRSSPVAQLHLRRGWRPQRLSPTLQALLPGPFSHIFHLVTWAGVRSAIKNPSYVHSNIASLVSLLEVKNVSMRFSHLFLGGVRRMQGEIENSKDKRERLRRREIERDEKKENSLHAYT